MAPADKPVRLCLQLRHSIRPCPASRALPPRQSFSSTPARYRDAKDPPDENEEGGGRRIDFDAIMPYEPPRRTSRRVFNAKVAQAVAQTWAEETKSRDKSPPFSDETMRSTFLAIQASVAEAQRRQADEAEARPQGGPVVRVVKEEGGESEREREREGEADWLQTMVDSTDEFDYFGKQVLKPASLPTGFWNEDEDDPEMTVPDSKKDEFDEDDIPSFAHAKLEELREYREYARLAVWDLPLLSKFARPFEEPDAEHVLRFRYTTYMGENHPADRKVVVEFNPWTLPDLTEAQQLKLCKLAGPRYNPKKKVIKMSSERFDHQAQNKRYLGDLVEKLMTEAKNEEDMFEDIPLDLRHHPIEKRLRFPVQWRMTPERQAELLYARTQSYLIDKAKEAGGGLVDGTRAIQKALAAHPVEDPVMVHASTGPMRRQSLR